MEEREETLEDLQNEWKYMFQHLLPEAARSKSPSQPKWPVQLDHCFARIILDSTVGMDTPWTSKIKSPAYKNMSKPQLRWSIELGRRILEGEEDLVELDNMSLELRGKNKKASSVVDDEKRKREGDAKQDGVVAKVGMKRKRIGEFEADPKPASKHQDNEAPTPSPNECSPYFLPTTSSRRPNPTSNHRQSNSPDLTPYLKKIALSHKTPFQKKVLSLLCQIPQGKYTTYAAISKHLSSHPRAVGSAIRNNPFAPHVPCHRVLASGGGIGGFYGSWGRNGEKGLNDDKKRGLLRDEGVRFDGRGVVVGGVWEGFK